jgi:hypothetical protein
MTSPLITVARVWEDIFKALGVAACAPVELGEFDWRSYRSKTSDLQEEVSKVLRSDFELADGLLRAVLLFHSGSPWDDGKQKEWERLTGKNEVTTKALCDSIRKSLGNENTKRSL